jgi:hypothetical protein
LRDVRVKLIVGSRRKEDQHTASKAAEDRLQARSIMDATIANPFQAVVDPSSSNRRGPKAGAERARRSPTCDGRTGFY